MSKIRLGEGSVLGRLRHLFNDTTTHMAIVSAFRGERTHDENMAMHETLKSKLREYRLGYRVMDGFYVENEDEPNEEYVAELSFLITEPRKSDALYVDKEDLQAFMESPSDLSIPLTTGGEEDEDKVEVAPEGWEFIAKVMSLAVRANQESILLKMAYASKASLLGKTNADDRRWEELREDEESGVAHEWKPDAYYRDDSDPDPWTMDIGSEFKPGGVGSYYTAVRNKAYSGGLKKKGDLHRASKKTREVNRLAKLPDEELDQAMGLGGDKDRIASEREKARKYRNTRDFELRRTFQIECSPAIRDFLRTI